MFPGKRSISAAATKCTDVIHSAMSKIEPTLCCREACLSCNAGNTLQAADYLFEIHMLVLVQQLSDHPNRSIVWRIRISFDRSFMVCFVLALDTASSS